MRFFPEIKKKSSKKIFLFGSNGASKSTLIACLARYVIESEDSLKLVRNMRDIKSNHKLDTQFLDIILDNRFPNRTVSGTLDEIDFGVERDGKSIGLTFLEMAGEDLKNVKSSIGGIDGYNEFIKSFSFSLLESKVCLIITSALEINKIQQDLLIHNFLETVKEQYIVSKKRLSELKFLLIISCWDVTGLPKTELDNYVISNYKSTHSWFKQTLVEHEFFNFSVGSVMENEIPPRIRSFNKSDSENILNWIINAI